MRDREADLGMVIKRRLVIKLCSGGESEKKFSTMVHKYVDNLSEKVTFGFHKNNM